MSEELKSMEVTVSLSFEVAFDVDAVDKDDAEAIAEEMHLTDFLEWATCASYDMNVVNIRENE